MFFNAKSFNQPIGDWNTSNVEGIGSMFSETSYFNQPIGDWDVSNVEENEDMLKEAKSYNQSFGNKKKNIDKSKYEYRIEISGRVSEYVCGSIKDDVWNYIKAEFNGDAKAYCGL